MPDRPRKRDAARERYRKGLPGHHDPTAGMAGAVPARSALTLRLWLAVFGLVTSTALAVGLAVLRAPSAFVVVLVVLAFVALVDIVVIARRKLRGEPG